MIKLIEHLDMFFNKHLDKLNRTDFIELNNLKIGELPTSGGIYIFYEKKEPIYVGRTNNLNQRIRLHIRNSSKEESATFVFNLAKKQIIKNNEDSILFNGERKVTRKELMKKPKFISMFNEKKKLVQNMKLKYIEENDDVIQTILEPYISVKLKTNNKYNSFRNH